MRHQGTPVEYSFKQISRPANLDWPSKKNHTVEIMQTVVLHTIYKHVYKYILRAENSFKLQK